jgi:ribonuclease HII
VVRTTSPELIDKHGVWVVLVRSHNDVHEALAAKLEARNQWGSTLHVVDGLENARARLRENLVPLPKADKFVPAVSLASCFAKVLQCELMERAAQRFPDHGFDQHHGYDTRMHRETLARFGVTPLHRKSFSTIRDLIGSDGASAHRRG